jgi:hypothetical protein
VYHVDALKIAALIGTEGGQMAFGTNFLFCIVFPHHSEPVFKEPFFTTKNFGLVFIQKFWW